MMDMGCSGKFRKIETRLEREGYPKAKAEHIAGALTYGQHPLHKRRR